MSRGHDQHEREELKFKKQNNAYAQQGNQSMQIKNKHAKKTSNVRHTTEFHPKSIL